MRTLATICLVGLLAPLAAGAELRKEQSVRGGLIVNLSADSMFECVPFASRLEDASKATLIEGYERLVDRYAGTQVTRLFLNVNFQRAAFESKAWDTYWDCDDPEKQTSGWPRKSWLVWRKGVDPFAVCIRRCRGKGLSPWLSMRMNDTHYIADPTKANTLWLEHPEYRRAGNSGFDFAVPAVREHHLALIRELLGRYDADGLELDWMRFAWHFKPGHEEQGRAILTDFTRQVRKLADAWAEKRGHPIGLAARVPSVPKFAVGLGMDGVAWARQGLVDILIPSATWRPTDTATPIEEWRRLIGEVEHEFRIAAAADLWIQCCPGGVLMRDNLESARGFTAAMLDRGADMIYLFNHFNTGDFRRTFVRPDGSRVVRDEHRTLLGEVGRLETVVGKPRRHVLTFRDTAPPGAPNPRPLPAPLAPGKPVAFRLYTGPKPTEGRIVIRVGLDDRPGHAEAQLVARLNAAECRQIADLNKPDDFAPPKGRGSHVVWRVAEVAPRVAQLEAPLAALRRGSNEVELRLERGGEQRIVWLELHITP